LGSRITRYVHNGQTDKSNAYFPLTYGRGHNNPQDHHDITVSSGANTTAYTHSLQVI